MQAEQVALETTTQQVQQEIFVVNEEQELARARVLFAQNITTSLTESITAQQERMTQTVRLHDERQAQQDKLYQALQRKKDEYRRNVLEASQRAQDLRAEIPRVKAEYAEQTKTLASMKKEFKSESN